MRKTKKTIAFIAALTIVVALGSCAWIATREPQAGAEPPQRFHNLYAQPEDRGERARWTYFFHRAWVQLTRDLSRTDVPPAIPLDFNAMKNSGFAVAWLGHASLLVRAGDLWVLVDPVFSDTAGPIQGLGPARLTPLPFADGELPHIDVVLISHDHFDHLDLNTVKSLAQQPGGAPAFFTGSGLGSWFASQVGSRAREFRWWEEARIAETTFQFVPAQHGSGRSAFHKNTSLWGGWVIRHAGKQFYFPGDTAFVAELFSDIRQRVGSIDIAALPIGAYQPRQLMRFEHLDPDEALHAHQLLQASGSFGVHWGTFQLGDEEPFQPAADLSAAIDAIDANPRPARFGLMPVGGHIALDRPHGDHWHAPKDLQPVRAKR